MPDVAERAAIWRRQLNGRTPEVADWAEDLAVRFALTPARIRDAIAVAEQESRRRPGAPAPMPDDLGAACRAQSSHSVADLASKIELRYGWDDLVLPERRLAAAARDLQPGPPPRTGCYEDWGFGRKLRHGQGAQRAVRRAARHRQDHGRRGHRRRRSGSTCTGSTCRGVVSKYIGETEKNLDAHLRRGAAAATPSCSSTRPTRCSASAPR